MCGLCVCCLAGKLTREHPTTAPIGSWGIISAVKRMHAEEAGREAGEEHEFTAATLFTRKGGRGLCVLTRAGDEEEAELHWSRLREVGLDGLMSVPARRVCV